MKSNKFMKIIIEQIKTNIDVTDNEIFEIAKARILKTRAFKISGDLYIYKRSIDARKKDDIIHPFLYVF